MELAFLSSFNSMSVYTGIITLRLCRFLPMPYSYNTELLCIWDIKVGFWMAVGVA